MRPRLGHAAWAGCWLAGWALSGCAGCEAIDLQGDEGSSGTPAGPSCDVATECPDLQSYRDGKCQITFCEADAECCPGTRCDLAINTCRSRSNDTQCTTEADCTLRGQKCVEPAGFKICEFPSCVGDAPCEAGLHCYKGSCVGTSPCGSGCPAGQVCDVGTASCHPALDHAGCAQSCGLGSLLVLKDPQTMRGEICCAWECECLPLPPLSPGVLGNYASVVAGGMFVDVAAYDMSYGDLVVVHHWRTGERVDVEYVDGFPATGTLGGAVTGPRRGITEPGDDVGKFASAALDALGRLHIAYFDATHGALKYALNVAPGQWSIHTVDDDGVAGQFASLAFRPSDGVPVLAYFATGLTGADGRPASAARLALARTPSPSSAADWTTSVLEQAPDFDPCNGACSANSTCVLASGTDGGSGAACRPNASTCTPSCSSSQACVDTGSGVECAGLGSPPIEGLPRAMGLFTSVAAFADAVVAAWYDGVGGNLRAVRVQGTGTPVTVTIDGDGQAGRADSDVGQYVSVAVDPNGKVGMVYVDQGRQELRYYASATLASGQFHVVESGRGSPPGYHLLGAGASLVFGQDATAYVVYQEQTDLDLRVAQREPSGEWTVWDPLEGSTPGPYGFYTDVAVAGGHAYLASVKPELDLNRQVASKLAVDPLVVPH
ncbi:MAG: hypothetical protein HY904_13725 [Deltaproteobacteria bacterium]|nr:hypothetical protein [Deltaproteobacteria bacterium]